METRERDKTMKQASIDLDHPEAHLALQAVTAGTTVQTTWQKTREVFGVKIPVSKRMYGSYAPPVSRGKDYSKGTK